MSKPNNCVQSSSQHPAQQCRNLASRAAACPFGKRLFQISPSDCFISGSSLQHRERFETSSHVVWLFACAIDIPIDDQACTKKGSKRTMSPTLTTKEVEHTCCGLVQHCGCCLRLAYAPRGCRRHRPTLSSR
ncbi:hypothetical protein M3J09_004018 [Ascochyta lentis]